MAAADSCPLLGGVEHGYSIKAEHDGGDGSGGVGPGTGSGRAGSKQDSMPDNVAGWGFFAVVTLGRYIVVNNTAWVASRKIELKIGVDW